MVLPTISAPIQVYLTVLLAFLSHFRRDFRTFDLGYSFFHFIEGTVFGNASSHVAFQCSAEVDWTECDCDDCWCNNTFESGSAHNLPTGAGETCKRDTIGSLIFGCTLPSREVSWIFYVEHRATFDEVAGLMQLDENDHVDDLPRLTKNMEDLPAVDVDEEVDWNLRSISPSG